MDIETLLAERLNNLEEIREDLDVCLNFIYDECFDALRTYEQDSARAAQIPFAVQIVPGENCLCPRKVKAPILIFDLVQNRTLLPPFHECAECRSSCSDAVSLSPQSAPRLFRQSKLDLNRWIQWLKTFQREELGNDEPATEKQLAFLQTLGGVPEGKSFDSAEREISNRLKTIQTEGFVTLCPYCGKKLRAFDHIYAICPHCRKPMFFSELCPFTLEESKDVCPKNRYRSGIVPKKNPDEFTNEAYSAEREAAKAPERQAVQVPESTRRTEPALLAYEETYGIQETHRGVNPFRAPRDPGAAPLPGKMLTALCFWLTIPFIWPFLHAKNQNLWVGVGILRTVFWWILLLLAVQIFHFPGN